MEDRTEELNYLKTVRHYINKILGGFDENLLDLKSYIKEERRRMWDDFVKDSNMPDMFELVQITQTEQRDQMRYERLIKQNEILKLLSGSPYFARIDIKELGLDREKIYIGRRSLIDKENSDVLVCDWRSDIASVFYESQLGETYYMTPMGKVDCEFLLRRQ